MREKNNFFKHNLIWVGIFILQDIIYNIDRINHGEKLRIVPSIIGISCCLLGMFIEYKRNIK